MLNHIKLTREEADNAIFISDLHINQGKQFLIDDRTNFLDQKNIPFSNPKEHDEWIWSQFEEHVNEDTIIFNLGDQVFRDGSGRIFERLAKVKCKNHYIIWGNHNSGGKTVYKKTVFDYIQKESLEIYPMNYDNVTFVGHDLKLYVGKQEVHMSHFPKSIWDNMSDKRKKNEQDRLSGIKPSFHLVGHSHGSYPETSVGHKMGKRLDVGVENAVTYGDKFHFTYSEIESIMEEKSVQVLDHHDGRENPS